MAHSPLIEILEDRRFLSATSLAPADMSHSAEPATLAAPRRVSFNPSILLGTYSGTVKLTKPTGKKPVKFKVVIDSIDTATKAVQGVLNLPKLNFTDITMAKSTFNKKTGEFTLRVITHGMSRPQTLQLTLHGFVTAQTLATKTIKHVHFSGFIPFNGAPRVAVDGYCDIKKS